MNKKAVIVIVIILAICCCVVVAGAAFWYITTQSATTGIAAVQSSLKDNNRKDFLTRVNLDINRVYSSNGVYPTVELGGTSKYLVTINTDILENIEDTSVDLTTQFCYARSTDYKKYSLKLLLSDKTVYSLGNSETLCSVN